jgi:putative ABC transport system permease protein
MTSKTFARLGFRYLSRHPWQSLLMIVGIMLGVAVVIAVDLANASASRAFDLSTEAVAGRATHQILGGPQGLDESLYTRLRRSGVVRAAAPVLSEYVSSPQLGGVPMQLLGIDPFAEAPFRSYLGSPGEASGGVSGFNSRPSPNTPDLAVFLTQPGAILISTSLAERYGLSSCAQARPDPACRLQLEIGGQQHPVFLAGLLQPADDLSRRGLENLILTDIASAQELTAKPGKLERIDLILPESCTNPALSAAEEAGAPSEEGCPEIGAVRALLPEGVRLERVEARSGTVEQMTSAFRVNLTALSLLALVVGLFLIYNTITFSVVQRRPLFGTLRCLGVTRGEIFALVLVEAFLLGLVGAGLGILLGILLGQGAVQLVTQTINDLFFTVSVRGVQAPPGSLVKGFLLGVVATLLAAAPPAWEAASVPPRLALSRSGLERKAQAAVWLAAGLGLVLLLLGVATLLAPSRDLPLSFSGTFAVVIGFALLAPLTTAVLMRLAGRPLGFIWGSLGRMAARDVVRSLSRTSIAVAALMVAVSVTIGVSLMVGSFRQTVVAWLGETLSGDIYISAPGQTANRTSTALAPEILPLLKEQAGVRQLLILRSVIVDAPEGTVFVAASDNPNLSLERSYLAHEVPVHEIPERMRAGAVIVSEPFANRLGLPRHGAEITLYTGRGLHTFPVAGIYYDYASTQGTVTMFLDVYRQYWDDQAVTAAALRLEPGTDPDQVVRELQGKLTPVQRLIIRPNAELRREVLEVFDRTFAITGALQILATVVAFIGVLASLLAIELERQRELGILRAVGLTARQLWGLIMIETGLMGAAAGLLALPTGYALALILVYIINRRSFGWTLQMQVVPDPFVLALVVAVSAALLAGIAPARHISRLMTSDAIRSE